MWPEVGCNFIDNLIAICLEKYPSTFESKFQIIEASDAQMYNNKIRGFESGSSWWLIYSNFFLPHVIFLE